MITRTLQLALATLALAGCSSLTNTTSRTSAPVSGATLNDKPIDQALASRGQAVWVNKGCYTCHAIGRKIAAPDLIGIMERRDHDWLRKWLLQTDAMIMSDDAQVKAMLEEWKGYKMPNMKLQPGDVEALFHYLAQETARARAAGK